MTSIWRNETYNRPNVTLIDTGGKSLDRITETGFVFDGKAYEVDCIIYASGFEVASPPDRTAGFEMHGAGGQTQCLERSKQFGANRQMSAISNEQPEAASPLTAHFRLRGFAPTNPCLRFDGSIMPLAIMAEGVVSWEYQTLIPTLASVGLGTLATWWARSAR